MIYEASRAEYQGNTVCMARLDGADVLLVSGPQQGEFSGRTVTFGGQAWLQAPLDLASAEVLRRWVPHTAPAPVLGRRKTIGLGDRLGIAGPGHLAALAGYNVSPVLAQQSIRELNLTGRNYEEVLAAATFAVFRAGYTGGYGADGDHLKTREEVAYALRCGFTMITLDCSEHIGNQVGGMTDAEVDDACTLPAEIASRYLGKTFPIAEGIELSFDELLLKRIWLIYGQAIGFAAGMYAEMLADKKGRVDFEVSIDETETPTLPVQHFFVANELLLRGVEVVTMAPRFCGEFQKGIDYIGDTTRFDEEMRVHAAIADHFGYKLSIHSGSDKFTVFPAIGRYTHGHYHVKTAGTSWLEAMALVAKADPALYREVHAYALQRFDDACKFYHVGTTAATLPDIAALPDRQLPALFGRDDVRQLIHITYGFILQAEKPSGGSLFRDRLYQLWDDHRDEYAMMLKQHLGRHLALLAEGEGG